MIEIIKSIKTRDKPFTGRVLVNTKLCFCDFNENTLKKDNSNTKNLTSENLDLLTH